MKSDLRILHQGLPSPRVDIVFVHGLGGDAETTWTHPKTQHFWPQDSLAKDIPDARIITYSYDTQPIGWKNTLSVSDFRQHAKNLVASLTAKRKDGDTSSRKIIFIAHSLGGLLTTQALQYLQKDTMIYAKQIVSCTIGLMFFGVPFSGSKLAAPARNLSYLLTSVGVGTVNKDILEVLGSQVGGGLKDFLNCLLEERQDHLSALTVVEELRTKGQIVVSQKSGSLPGIKSITFYKNHSDLVKFEDEFDRWYRRTVDDYLKPWINKHQLNNEFPDGESRAEDGARLIDNSKTDQGRRRAENSNRSREYLRQMEDQSSDITSTDENTRGLADSNQRREESRNHESSTKERGLGHNSTKNYVPGSINIGGSNPTFHGSNIGSGGIVNNHYHTKNEQPQGITPRQLKMKPPTSENHPVRREDLLDKLDEAFKRPNSRIALQGLSGMGKTQLAITYGDRFADNIKEKYWVLWVDAHNETSLKQSFGKIAIELEIPGFNDEKIDQLQIVFKKLRDEEDIKWLLVFDNIDDLEIFDQFKESEEEVRPWDKCFPQNNNGSILITSRYDEVTDEIIISPDETIPVDGMTKKDALKLCEEKLSEKAGEIDPTACEELVKELAFTPLEIVHAASYISKESKYTSNYSVKDFLKAFRHNWSEWLQHKGNKAKERRGVFVMWKLSLDRMKEKRPSAVHLFYLMSCFDHQGIPRVLFQPAEAKYNFAEGDVFPKLGKLIKNHAYQDDNFDKDIRLLQDYSFVSMNSGYYSMHPLLHASAREWRPSKWFEIQSTHKLLLVFPSRHHEYMDDYRMLLPHLNVVLNRPPPGPASLSRWPWLMYRAATFASFVDDDSSMERFSEAVIAFSKAKGLHNSQLADCYAYLGHIYDHKNDFEKCENSFKKAIEIFKELGNGCINDLLHWQTQLARKYQRDSLHVKADNIYKEIRTLDEKSGAKFHGDSDYLNSVATAYHHVGDINRATDLFRIAIEIEERNENWILIAKTKHNIALTYWREHEWEKSRKYLVDALGIGYEKGAVDMPCFLSIACDLAVVLNYLNEFEKALSLTDDCYKRYYEIHGAEDIRTQATLRCIEALKHNIKSSSQLSEKGTLLGIKEGEEEEKEEMKDTSHPSR